MSVDPINVSTESQLDISTRKQVRAEMGLERKKVETICGGDKDNSKIYFPFKYHSAPNHLVRDLLL